MLVALSHLGFLIQRKPRRKNDVPDLEQAPIVPNGEAKTPMNHVVAIRMTATDQEAKGTLPRQLLSLSLEDYFQAEAFRERIRPEHWYRFESRLVEPARKALALLERSGVRATVFVSAWVAERFPGFVAEVAGQGHEIALLGEVRSADRVISPEEFRDELRRGRETIERLTERAVVGFRFSQRTLATVDSRTLGVLFEEGFAYVTGRGVGQPTLFEQGGSSLWLIPEPAPGPIYQPASRSMKHGRGEANPGPALINVHAWEFDPGQPRIEAIPRRERLRHYRHLGETPAILEACFETCAFEGIAESLGIDRVRVESGSTEAQVPASKRPVPRGSLTPISLVVPCFNEEPTVKYLANTLKTVRERLGERFDLRLVLVDDGSTDETWRELRRAFDRWPEVSLVRHERNRGVAASILTGINHAETEVVCSIDCDCTYDPHELAGMVPLLTEDIDVVTASPYHPLGMVRNVPAARLFLSKSASFLYRQVFRQKLFTYTSCFRVYRRSAVEGMKLTYPGFLGMVEILGRLDLRGSRVVEYPTTLEVRVFGQSKMKLARTIVAHLGLLSRLLWTRLGPVSTFSSASTLREDARGFGYSTQKG